MWNALCFLMATIGFVVSVLLFVALFIAGIEKFDKWQLRRRTLFETMDKHHSDIAKLKMQVVFLERCERERTARENEASRKAAKKKGCQ